jgi:Mn-dependent DtxR family transcriptional regulator
MGVTPASASGMVKRLGELGLVSHVGYRGVSLTDAGRRVALEVIATRLAAIKNYGRPKFEFWQY